MSYRSTDTGERILNAAEQAIYDEATDDLARIHGAYTDMLAALVKTCHARRILISRHELAMAMEGIGEALAGEADAPRSKLADLGISCFGYVPDDAEHLCDKAHEKIVDFFRVKPAIEQLKESLEFLRPITNPQTFDDMGKAI